MTRMLTWVAGAVVMGVIVVVPAAGATTLDVRTSRIIVFKDGYCMVVKQATGKLDTDRKAVMKGIPSNMVLGSFWVIPKGPKPTSMVSQQTTFTRQGRQETEKKIVFEFDPKADANVDLTIVCFGPGVRWIPTYRIGLGDGGNADMTMQAELLNELEDLEGVPVDLVVGVPNFRFKSVISPMALEASLRNILQEAAPQLMSQSMSNTLFTQRSGEFRGQAAEAPAPAAPGAPALPPELIGEGAQDLFVYTVPRLSLQAGQRAAVPLITASVPFRHLYTWDVRLTRSGTEGLGEAGPHPSPIKLLKNDVWHHIEMTNTTGLPWTTGAALTMQGFLPLGQELLTYTSAGGKCQLPLTVAIDVRGTYVEEETAREPQGVVFNKHTYARVNKKGTLRVTNYKKEPIDLVIQCDFGGKATAASDDGKITLTDFTGEDWTNFRGHPALTPHSNVRWSLNLKAGDSKEVTCEYHYYTE